MPRRIATILALDGLFCGVSLCAGAAAPSSRGFRMLPPATARRLSPFLAVALVAWAGLATADCDAGCRGSIAGTPGDELVADGLGLSREWVVQLPFDSSRGRLQHVVIGDGLVVAQTGDGRIHAVRTAALSGTAATLPGAAAVGSLLWSRDLGPAGAVATPPGIGPSLVTTTRNSDLHALERGTGAERWQRPLGGRPGAGAGEFDGWVYAPLEDGSIRRFTANPLQPTVESARQTAARPAKRADKKGQSEPAAAAKPTADSLRPRTFDSGGQLAWPPQSLGDGLVWVSTDGRLVALQQAPTKWERFEFSLNTPPTDRPVIRGKSVFVATAGSDLARVDLGADGLRTGWHVVLDKVPSAGPLVGDDTVVVGLGDDGLAAFAAATGAPLWRSCVIGRPLAIAGDRIWVLDATGRLSGVDLSTGQRRERLCLGGLSWPVVNTVSDRLVLASPEGLLVSLAPRRAGRAQPVAEPPAAEPAAAPAPAEAERPADADPPADGT